MLHCPSGRWIRAVRLKPVSSSQSSRSADLDDRIYTQLSPERVQELAEDHREAAGRVDGHSITPEEVLEQTNKIFAPYKISFAAPLAWFVVWKSKYLFFIPRPALSARVEYPHTDVLSLRASRAVLFVSRSSSPPWR